MRRFELFDDPLHLALPADHPLAAPRAAPRLEDLREESWVQTSAASPCARHVVRSCHAAGFEPRVSFESDDYQTVQGLVAAGVGVGLIPQLALSDASASDIVRPRPGTRRARSARSSPPPRGPPPATAAVATMLDILREVSPTHASTPPESPKREPPPGEAGAVPSTRLGLPGGRPSGRRPAAGAAAPAEPTPSG